MKCITPDNEGAILQDIHSGICGSHMCARYLEGKTHRKGYFWPTAVSDTDSLVHRCEGCQFFARQKHVPSHQLQTVTLTWPFSTWVLDLVAPFKKATGGFTHIFFAVYKFTKWIEVNPFASITVAKAVEFFKEIMYIFGVPNNITTAREFQDFCVDSGIKINYCSVSHSQSNGQMVHSNGTILQGLKPRIFDRLKPYTEKWVKELPSVLWAHHTTLSHTTSHTPFSPTYKSKAMLPTKVEHKFFCVQHFNEEQSDDS
jgi:hypothetical protein